MNIIVFLLIFLINLSLIFCTSSGLLISVCDAESTLYGCSEENFVDGNRLNCSESTQIMSWVVKPVSTDYYTVSLGLNEEEPKTTYKLNELINIHVRSNVHGDRIRGVMMYAVDSQDNRVGSWEFTDEDPSYWQHAPEPCEKTVLHATGVEKAYHFNNLYFRTPSEWVGTIYFKCLLKIGEANTGYFYWPKGTVENEIQLVQDNEPVNPQLSNWFLSKLGQSCTDTCTEQRKFCNINVTKQISTEEALIQNIMPNNPCKLPLLASCNNLGPKSSSDGYCYYADTEESCLEYETIYEETTCDSSSFNEAEGYRWCYCDGEITSSSNPTTNSNQPTTDTDITSNPTSGSSTTTSCNKNSDCDSGICGTDGICLQPSTSESNQPTTNPNEPTSISCTENSDCESGICRQDGLCYSDNVSIANSRFLSLNTLIFIFCSFFFGNKFDSKIILIYFVISLFIGGIEGHNWMNSPGRSRGTASLTKPCLPKLSNLPHVQVGSMQHFLIEWKTGHADSIGMFITAHESSYDKFTEHTINYGQTYLDETPQGVTNYASQSKYERYYRGFSSHANDMEYSDTDPEWIPVPGAFINTPNRLASYKTEFKENDRFVLYENPNFPHIESLRKHVTAPFMGANNIDTAFQFIEGKQGPGRYIIHYLWGGYRDCVEVDLMDYIVDFPYGIGSDGATYTTIPHCYFAESSLVFLATQAKCHDCVANAGASILGCTSLSIGDCGGVQINPYNVPDTINPIFRDFAESMIPWDETKCNQTLPTWLSKTEEQLKGAHVCRPIVPREATSTTFVYELTDDPLDPIFYSTCIYRTSVRIFEGYNNTDNDNNSEEDTIGNGWRFQNKCISCKNKAQNEVSAIPKFELTKRCVNCDIEPTIPDEPYIGVLLDPQDKRPGNKGSGDCNGTLCFKGVGSLSDESSGGLYISLEDCATLVANDPECTPYFSRRTEATTMSCLCWRDLECCGELRTLGFSRSKVYRVTKDSLNVPDPSCNTGIISSNVCCSKNDLGETAACITQQNCTQSAPPCFL